LNPIDNLPGKTFDSELLILPSIQKNYSNIASNDLVLLNIGINEFFFDDKVFLA
jgi:hypothetical protein